MTQKGMSDLPHIVLLEKVSRLQEEWLMAWPNIASSVQVSHQEEQ